MLKPVRLQRSRRKGSRLVSPNGLPVVCVTRGTKWGNPYPGTKIKLNSTQRAVVVGEFETALRLGILGVTVDDVRCELRGKNLACWCPLDAVCHADVLLEIASEPIL